MHLVGSVLSSTSDFSQFAFLGFFAVPGACSRSIRHSPLSVELKDPAGVLWR